LTEISPLNGRSWLAISSTDTATPVAKIPMQPRRRRANLRFGLSWKTGGQQYRHPNCAGRSIDCRPSMIQVAPYLDNTKYDQQTENSPQDPAMTAYSFVKTRHD
jgi:hypothetical protein